MAERPAEPSTASIEEAHAALEVFTSRTAVVGSFTVRRALPRPGHSTVGAWCFADHMGPATVTVGEGLDVGPHPHMGLQTVTWLIHGEGLHRDSLGSEQLLTPGQLNLMTAGTGVSHSEEATGRYAGTLAGIQLWIAQPEATRHEPAAFEHHSELPRLDLTDATATVLLGALDGVESPARRDSELLGADLSLRATTVVPLDPSFEHGLIVLEGAIRVDEHLLIPGHLGYLGIGRDQLVLETTERARVILLGGAPFDERIEMWWNFVGRSQAELGDAYRSWRTDDGRFGMVASPLNRIAAPTPTWLRP